MSYEISKGSDESRLSYGGDKGPPASTSVISQLRDWRDRNRRDHQLLADPTQDRTRTHQAHEDLILGPKCSVQTRTRLITPMLLLRSKVFLGVLLLICVLIDISKARRGRTRSRTKSKVQIGLPITGKYRDPESDQYYNNNDGAKILLASHFDLEYVLGHKIAFLCIAKGSPRPHVTWFKDGVEIFAHHYLHIHEWPIGDDRVKSKIEIDPATQMDAGVYECTADNMYSIDRRSFKTDFSIAFD